MLTDTNDGPGPNGSWRLGTEPVKGRMACAWSAPFDGVASLFAYVTVNCRSRCYPSRSWRNPNIHPRSRPLMVSVERLAAIRN